jgi:hypothetical protein
MENMPYPLFLILILVIIIIIIIIIVLIFLTKGTSQDIEDIEDVEYPLVTEDELITVNEDYNLYPSLNLNTLKMALLFIPANQPPLNPEAKKYRGFHITCFPTQTMPADYNLVEVMKGFNFNNNHWTLTKPGISTKLKKATSKNLLLMMIYGSKTLPKIQKYLLTQGWSRPWPSWHITLGNLDPPNAADPQFFINQTSWYIQLVINSGPVKNRGWPINQRVLLQLAQGDYN